MTKHEDRPLYLVASERSGTNLLRKRLSACQSVYFGPSPAHFLKHLYYREPFYGDLSDDARFSCLVADALDLCVVHFSPWKTRMNVDEVMATYGGAPRNVIQVAHFLMTAYAREVGYQSYFCKDNQLFEFTSEIVRELPGSRFIYLYRDPRDFVLSQAKRVAASASALRHARLWRNEQLKAICAANSLRMEGRCHFVSYEELVEDEDATLAGICAYLGVEMEAPAHVPNDSMPSVVHDWHNLDRPTLKQNHGKFMREMTRTNIERVELICAEPMAWLGYERVTTTKRKITLFERLAELCMNAIAGLQALLLPRGTAEQKARSRLLKRLGIHRPGSA